jgi:amidohydrolase
LTVARILSAHRNDIAGTVKFVFQPAEEGLGGAEAMIADGVLLNPIPDLCLAMHVWNEKPLGWLGITAGPVMSASDVFQMRITGKGGHGAAPHQTIDPVLASAHVITTLQSIVSRNLNPLRSAVVSITMIHGGEAHNVVPSSVDLKGSLRSFEPEVRKQLIERFRDISTSVAEGLGCQVQLDFKRISPPVYNDPKITQRVQKIVTNLFPESVIDSDSRSMGSEDMAFMMDQIPGCYIFLGSANASRGLDAGHHHPRFDFDEEILPRGAAIMAATISDYLKLK